MADSARRERPSRLLKVLPWALLAIALAYFVFSMRTATANDLKVYRFGGESIIEGRSLYTVPTPGTSVRNLLPEQVFTYPPFAAVAFIPFALASLPVAAVAWWIISLTALAVSCVLIARSMLVTAGPTLRLNQWEVAAVLLAGALAIEPTIINAQLGQINVAVMLLVLVDVLVPWRYSGVLTGLAAGLKVVPAVFILLMMLTRRWTEAVRAVAAFGLTVIIGFAVVPDQAWRYWTGYLWDASRVGDPGRNDNQSLLADLIHINRAGTSTRLLWFVGAIAIAVVAFWLAVRLWPFDRLLSVTTIAIGALATSPVAWTHHWVWVVPLGGGLAAVAIRLRSLGRIVAATAVWAAVAILAVGMILRPVTFVYTKLGHSVQGIPGRWLIVLGSNGYMILTGIAMLSLVWIGWKAPEIWRSEATDDDECLQPASLTG